MGENHLEEGMFRAVTLPDGVKGRLFLHSMPGRYEGWNAFLEEAGKEGIDLIVCLTPEEEVERKSPDYARAVKRGRLPFRRESFPIEDFGTTHDLEGFSSLVLRVAGELRSGKGVLVHCGAGIGRTGTFATCLLLALGMKREEAERAVREAGANPEAPAQEELIDWCEMEFGGGK